ncbi:NUDIX hydrolase [Bacillus gobiensis]|uniref:NUDIX hydrolase n=1 Tax=Bacillus gobiensis TaxID=1441095 RepID=UPI003D1C39C9
MSNKWLDWAKQIHAISQTGLAYSKDVYDKERYEQLLRLSTEIFAEYTDSGMEKIKLFFSKETGYQTPKVDVRGVVFKENKILLVKENSDQRWALPGGFCDVGLSPAENAVKEIKEESGYDTVSTKLLAVLDYHKHPHPPDIFHYYKIFIQCELIGGSPSMGVETNDVQFFSESNLPELSINRNTESQIKLLFEFLRNPQKEAIVD